MVGVVFSSQILFHLMTHVVSGPVGDIKLGDSRVMIWYQIDAFTHNWLEQIFITWSHLPWAHEQCVNTNPTSYLSLSVRINFLDLTESVKTLKLDSSFDKFDTVTSSASSGFLCLVNTVSDNYKLSIKTLKLDASFDKFDIATSSGFLCSDSTVSDHS